MFELQGSINRGDDVEPINYAAVISSIGYPDSDTSEDPRISIYKIPVGAYVTYTLLTENNFVRHLVQITDYGALGAFKMGLSSPFSLKHEDNQSTIKIDTSRNPVFLLKYAGKPPT